MQSRFERERQAAPAGTCCTELQWNDGKIFSISSIALQYNFWLTDGYFTEWAVQEV